MTGQVKCEVADCGDAATRVIHGGNFCWRHDNGQLVSEVPITPCDVEGCGCPAVAKVEGRDFCSHHAGHWPFPAAA